MIYNKGRISPCQLQKEKNKPVSLYLESPIWSYRHNPKLNRESWNTKLRTPIPTNANAQTPRNPDLILHPSRSFPLSCSRLLIHAKIASLASTPMIRQKPENKPTRENLSLGKNSRTVNPSRFLAVTSWLHIHHNSTDHRTLPSVQSNSMRYAPQGLFRFFASLRWSHCKNFNANASLQFIWPTSVKSMMLCCGCGGENPLWGQNLVWWFGWPRVS